MSNSRFLVVDDDPVSLQKLTIILSDIGNCETASTGNEAVGFFVRNFNANIPYDLVALDIGLPDVKGTEVLARIRQFEKSFAGAGHRTKIIMITSHTDREVVQKALKNGCDGYIVKPFDKNKIFDKLAEFGWIAGLDIEESESSEPVSMGAPHTPQGNSTPPQNKPVTEDKCSRENKSTSLKNTIIGKLKEIKTGNFTLPGQPDLYLKLKDMVDDGANLTTVSDLLKNHSAITGSLIRISNTSRYRGISPNKSLSEAIGRLGLHETLEQVCAISTKEMCNNMPAKYQAYSNAVWKKSLACAFTCEVISKSLNPTINVDPFTLGLMHDIGKMAMLRIFEHIETQKVFSGEVSLKTMTPIIGQYEGVLGSMLLQQWSLPEEYQKVARYHGKAMPDNASLEELSMTNLAIDLVKIVEQSSHTEDLSTLIQPLIKRHAAHYPMLNENNSIEIVTNVSSALNESLNALE